MRTICDVCEGAPAVLFCAADEAALCRRCDAAVHSANRLAGRHSRVALLPSTAIVDGSGSHPTCDICQVVRAYPLALLLNLHSNSY